MCYSIQFFRTILVTASLLLLLAACGGGNSSSEDSSAEVTVTTDSGATATFASDEITAGEVAELIYNLSGEQFTATIHWGDGTTTRVRGSGVARHGYDIVGNYTLAIQIDGPEPTFIRGLQVTVVPAAVTVSSVTAPSATSSGTGSFIFSSSGSFSATFPCNASAQFNLIDPNGANVAQIRHAPGVLPAITVELPIGEPSFQFNCLPGERTSRIILGASISLSSDGTNLSYDIR